MAEAPKGSLFKALGNLIGNPETDSLLGNLIKEENGVVSTSDGVVEEGDNFIGNAKNKIQDAQNKIQDVMDKVEEVKTGVSNLKKKALVVVGAVAGAVVTVVEVADNIKETKDLFEDAYTYFEGKGKGKISPSEKVQNIGRTQSLPIATTQQRVMHNNGIPKPHSQNYNDGLPY